jgi:hypothetical protein
VLRPKEFRELCRHFDIDYSTGRKLVHVGRSDRIEKHKKKLPAIPWSTAYEITLLDDNQFAHFEAVFLAKETVSFTRADVRGCKTGTGAKNGARAKGSRLETALVVKLDLNQIEYEDVFKVIEETNNYQDRLSAFPAVHITRKGLVQRLPLKTGLDLNLERAVREARNQLWEVVAGRIAEMPGPDRQAQWLESTGLSWGEIFDPKVNPNTVLEKLGEKPVKPHLVSIYFKRYENADETSRPRALLQFEELINGTVINDK